MDACDLRHSDGCMGEFKHDLKYKVLWGGV